MNHNLDSLTASLSAINIDTLNQKDRDTLLLHFGFISQVFTDLVHKNTASILFCHAINDTLGTKSNEDSTVMAFAKTLIALEIIRNELDLYPKPVTTMENNNISQKTTQLENIRNEINNIYKLMGKIKEDISVLDFLITAAKNLEDETGYSIYNERRKILNKYLEDNENEIREKLTKAKDIESYIKAKG